MRCYNCGSELNENQVIAGVASLLVANEVDGFAGFVHCKPEEEEKLSSSQAWDVAHALDSNKVATGDLIVCHQCVMNELSTHLFIES